MSFTEKIDVLDLLINILREHEERMDDLVSRLEIVANQLSQSEPASGSPILPEAGQGGPELEQL